MTWLVAGLGNPGPSYERTRHNAGAMVVQVLADRVGGKLRKARFVPAETAEFTDPESRERIVLVRSTRFMNESGPSYASLAKKAKVDPSHVIAVHDEIDLPFGEVRTRVGGGLAGHNGLKSVAVELGSREFARVRVGVGRPDSTDPDVVANYVLSKFREPPEEVGGLVGRAADAAEKVVAGEAPVGAR